MFNLKLPTDPRWVNIAEKHVKEILIDHAWCEQKAASNAISIILAYPEYSEIVCELSAIAQEEMAHFEMVHQEILKRGWVLAACEKDLYVNDLFKLIRQGSRLNLLLDRLLFAAMIEARSCERFKLLSEQISDESLREFYKDLMISEANHYTTFISLARKYCGKEQTDERWAFFLEEEAKILQNYSKSEKIHG